MVDMIKNFPSIQQKRDMAFSLQIASALEAIKGETSADVSPEEECNKKVKRLFPYYFGPDGTLEDQSIVKNLFGNLGGIPIVKNIDRPI